MRAALIFVEARPVFTAASPTNLRNPFKPNSPMAFDNLNMDEVTEARREAIRDTLHTITVEELRSIGESLFPSAEHPWRDKFFGFISENAGATFYHAVTDDRIHVIYCPAQEKGMWCIQGSGMGPLQAKGVQIMKELTGAKR
jgi:hypothetical protein